MHLTCITTQEMRFCKIVCLFYMRYLEKILMSKTYITILWYFAVKQQKKR